MLSKGQITQQRKRPIRLLVVSLVFIAMCSIYEFKSNNFQVTVEVLLRVAPTLEESGRRRKKIIADGNTKNFNVSRNCKQDIIFPIEILPTVRTTTIPIT